MSTAPLQSQLLKLVELQGIDSRIYALNAEAGAVPQQLSELDAAFELKKAHLAELEKKSLDIQKLRKERELELGSKEENRKKLQSQLYSLKTNKEYQAMMQQIEEAKADASVIEDKILALFDDLDRIKADVTQEQARLKEEEKVVVSQKAKLEARLKEIHDQLSQLNGQRAQVTPAIEPKILAQYDRILQNRDGLAIVPVRNFSCQGCNMSAPPQVVNLIKMYEHLITCEVCNRILYVEDGQ